VSSGVPVILVVTRVVVVVAHQDAAVAQLEDHFDRDEWERERVADPERARRGLDADETVGAGLVARFDEPAKLVEVERLPALRTLRRATPPVGVPTARPGIGHHDDHRDLRCERFGVPPTNPSSQFDLLAQRN
jgi:hypothetical protein